MELSEKLEALQTQGLDEADRATATTALLIEFSSKMQTAAVAKAQAAAATSINASAHHTTIIAEQSEKIALKSLSNEDLQHWGDKLKARQVVAQRPSTEAQLSAMTTEKQRTVITQAFRMYRFADGSSISDAENWLQCVGGKRKAV